MAAKVVDTSNKPEIVKAPGNLVISAYVTCPDISKVISPDIKRPGESRLLYIDLGGGKYRTGGSAFAHVYGQIGDEAPDVDDPQLLKRAFRIIQQLIEDDLILSGHDRSDGGLIVTLLEMAFGGNCGLEATMSNGRGMGKNSEFRTQNPELSVLFSEELGFVIEYFPEREQRISDMLKQADIPYQIIGKTLPEKQIIIQVNDQIILKESMQKLRAVWEETSYQLDRLQADPDCVEEERGVNFDRKGPQYKFTFIPENSIVPPFLAGGQGGLQNKISKVAILREEGSNGDREMASAFYHAGFEVWDITMTDLLDGAANLNDFRGLAFVGGFSYADVLDSAKGWAGVIRFNEKLFEQFEDFYERPDTFSLGVCNGCQLMALLGWIPWRGIPDHIQPRFVRNRSGRFESRFSTVSIMRSPSIMLQGMEGSTLGVWVAHGEGRLIFPDSDIMEEVLHRELAPVRFVDDNNEYTEVYPFNPNGSPSGMTALCSPDGRHLAMMPHPERTFLKWQWAYMPGDWKQNLTASPWLRMFQNARKWCR
jgi:phosphoribosylformylglycinamidine synthase